MFFINQSNVLKKGTLCEAVKELKNFGAKSVIAFATHGLFSDPAFERIKQSSVNKIVTTNTIPKRKNEESTDKIVRLSVAPLLAETIRRIQENESVSRLFKSHK
jgi:ribose-phosphate pyrophosphokinase